MKLRPLGTSDFQVSEMGLGALHFGVFLNQDEATRLVHAAQELGITFIDTAPIYGSGKSESILGYALKGRRRDVFLSTKVGLAPVVHSDGRFGVKTSPLDRASIFQSVENSLRALQVDSIDLLQLHAFDSTTPLATTFEAISALLETGKIRAFGCSNYDLAQLQAALREMPQSIRSRFVSFQAHFNVLERRAATELFPTCQESQLGVICNRALARGVLSGRYRKGQDLPANSRAAVSARIRDTLSDPVLDCVQSLHAWAESQGHTCPELALAWVLSHPAVSVTLVGARNIDQLTLCTKASDWALTAADRTVIDRILGESGLTERSHRMPEVFFEQ